MSKLFKHLLFALGYGLSTSLLILIAVYIYILENRPDLKPWHQAKLDAEFNVQRSQDIKTLDNYRQLEDALFQQLRERVFAKVAPEDQLPLNRYAINGVMNTLQHQPNWNLTFELSHENPEAGVAQEVG